MTSRILEGRMATAQTDSRIALVTGANKGIGYEIARALAGQGITVLLGCRDPSRGQAAAERIGSAAAALELDVTRRATIDAAARQIQSSYQRLDILINNAGVSLEPRAKPSEVDLERVKAVYETNVFGVIAVTQALLPLLRASTAGRIVNISSSLGSLTLSSDPAAPWARFGLLGYNSSKSALNALTVMFASELKDSRVKVNAACPGYVATDLNQHSGYLSAAEGAQIAVRLANLPADGPTGGFFSKDGPVPW
jgi:NAD(P)-dependent dehydrogenase (short-subunit alcohol dehydrogenase family)